MIGSNRFCHFGGWRGRQAPRRWRARPAERSDRAAWEELFEGYCEFYERPSTPAGRDRVWSWIEAGTIRCLLAVPAAATSPIQASGPPGLPVGLAHLRPCPSPLRGAVTGYLDDLFVAPAARGGGAFEALVGGVRDLAAAEGWEIVRWITAADNPRAQAAYARVATRTDWITYQLDV